jgi:hypothetical protein
MIVVRYPQYCHNEVNLGFFSLKEQSLSNHFSVKDMMVILPSLLSG